MSEVTKMEAGRELDALVAEKVLSHRLERSGATTWEEVPIRGTKDGIITSELRYYSVSIDAAWKVVDELCRRFPAKDSSMPAIMLVYRGGAAGPEWIAKCQHRVNGMWHDEWTESSAATVPLAICRAALLALEVA
jgi:hypothetical protein